MTTIATFFSSITGAALAFLNINSTVNGFWFSSIVFSIASAVYSLLGLTWYQSPMCVFPFESHTMTVMESFCTSRRPRAALPQWAFKYFMKAPMLLLVIAAIAFIIGLVIFAGGAVHVSSLVLNHLQLTRIPGCRRTPTDRGFCGFPCRWTSLFLLAIHF